MSVGDDMDETTRIARRTITRSAAWSVPVVTVALAAPALAASGDTTVDLAIEGQPFGETMSAISPDKSTEFSQTYVGGFTVTNLSGVDTPAGATVTISIDQRLVDAPPELRVDDVAVTAGGTTTQGNVQTTTFTISDPIPAGGSVDLRPRLNFVDGPAFPYFADVEDYTVSVAPPQGTTDATTANNALASAARYEPTSDAVLSVVWEERTLNATGGGTLRFNVPKQVTVTAQAPGDVVSPLISLSSVQVSSGDNWVGPVEQVRITRATLAGADVTSSGVVAPDSDDSSQTLRFDDTTIPAGQALVVDIATDLSSDSFGSIYDAPYVQVLTSSGDRDETNNRVDGVKID